MKKKLIIVFSIIVLLVLIIVLFIKNNAPFYLDDEYYQNSSLIEVDSEKIISLEKNKSSFVVFVHPSYCSSAYDIDDIIDEFIDTYKISFYNISFSTLKDTNMENYVKYCPSVVIYKNGKIVSYLDASLDKDTSYFQSIEGFKTWFTKSVLLK